MLLESVEKVKKSQRVKIENVKQINLKRSNFERPPSNKCVEVTVDSEEIKKILGGKISGKRILRKRKIDYPVGLYNHIDTASRQKRATLPSKVGKVHEMFRGRKFRSLNEYKKIYSSKFPDAIGNAVEEILEDFKRLGIPSKKRREYKRYVKLFVEELVIGRSYRGLKIQEVILIKMANILKQDYRWGTNKEDSSGIDGFIGDIPVSVKPDTCQQKKKEGVKRAYYTIDEKNSILSFTFSL